MLAKIDIFSFYFSCLLLWKIGIKGVAITFCNPNSEWKDEILSRCEQQEKDCRYVNKLEFAFVYVLKITILFPQGNQMYLSKLKWDQLPSLLSTDIILKYDNNAKK